MVCPPLSLFFGYDKDIHSEPSVSRRRDLGPAWRDAGVFLKRDRTVEMEGSDHAQ